MEKGRQEDQQILKSKSLKEVYPDVEQRSKFAAGKLEGKGANQILVRCEPHPTQCRIDNTPFLFLIAPAFYELAYLSATIHSRVSKSNGGEHSTYLFCNSKLVTAFREKIGPFW